MINLGNLFSNKEDLRKGLVITFLASSIMFLLLSSIAQAGCCDDCTVRIKDIDVEKVDSVNKDYLCPGDRFRVHAEVSISGESASVEAKLYINGDFYDNEIVYISEGSYRNVLFDRIIDSDDWYDCDCGGCGCYCGDYEFGPEIRVYAEAYCGSDEETFSVYFDDWCWDHNTCYYCDYWSSDYGKLRVRVVDCETDDAITDATVEVERGNYNVKTTHYDGYAKFTLPSGIYDVTVSKSGYETETEEVRVYDGRTRTLEICLGGDCEEGYLNEFRCLGPYAQGKYLYSDCTEQWKILEYCPSGCVDGDCLPAATTTTTMPVEAATKPLFSLEPVYEIEVCEVTNFTFKVINLGPQQDFIFETSGAGEDLIYVPSSAVLDTGENTVTAYAYMCDPGEYEFSIQAKSDSMVSTSHSVLRVYTANPLISILDAFLLSILVIVVVLVILKKFLPAAMGRIRKIERPESFRSKDI
jgi:hypothetical protein